MQENPIFLKSCFYLMNALDFVTNRI